MYSWFSRATRWRHRLARMFALLKFNENHVTKLIRKVHFIALLLIINYTYIYFMIFISHSLINTNIYNISNKQFKLRFLCTLFWDLLGICYFILYKFSSSLFVFCLQFLLMFQVCGDEEEIKRAVTMLPKALAASGVIYTRIDTLYTIHDLHSLP